MIMMMIMTMIYTVPAAYFDSFVAARRTAAVAKIFASSTASIFSFLVSCARSVAVAICAASLASDSIIAVARFVSLVAASNLAVRGNVADDRQEGMRSFFCFNNKSINQSRSPVAARTLASASCARVFISFSAAIIAALMMVDY